VSLILTLTVHEEIYNIFVLHYDHLGIFLVRSVYKASLAHLQQFNKNEGSSSSSSDGKYEGLIVQEKSNTSCGGSCTIVMICESIFDIEV
jgi:hypothetical protein